MKDTLESRKETEQKNTAHFSAKEPRDETSDGKTVAASAGRTVGKSVDKTAGKTNESTTGTTGGKMPEKRDTGTGSFVIRLTALFLVILALGGYEAAETVRAKNAQIVELQLSLSSAESERDALENGIREMTEEIRSSGLADALESGASGENNSAAGSGSVADDGSGSAAAGGNGSAAAGTAESGSGPATDGEAGNGGEASGNSADASADSEEGAYKDGQYEGEADGYGGKIKVLVTVSGGAIASINVTEHSGEDAAYFTFAETETTKIIDAQSTDVDAVTGATMTSNGIKSAVAAALAGAEN